ncbi:substrate-binding domain-containing protein [Exilibacterium tricleocarpae]|uniref:Substrate-binding domain-containing protein n=1 Tax=Exilibacterium tricleocarpae TaxID=2591008 RepID=A0A545SMW0_9GAMM|nr:substrate-binding domain-containing protein [Exilibacterium tricleocarpae]TQV66291.1 substrate-binding domain-containing protein [Exilibacterium tricleocarpae]
MTPLKITTRILYRVLLTIGLVASPYAPAETAPLSRADLVDARQIDRQWRGPRSGPAAAPGKRILYLAQDFRNGGILGVAEGVREAVKAIGWQLDVVDLHGADLADVDTCRRLLSLQPDGLVTAGVDARSNLSCLRQFQRLQIPVVGWHVGPDPGPISGTPVAMNVTTDNLAVARLAASVVVNSTPGQPTGVVIFTDGRFDIARRKADLLAAIIRRCEHCDLLAVEDISLAEIAFAGRAVADDLLRRFGRRWTHSLAINDLYYDAIAPVLALKGGARDQIQNVSAGDGSRSAYLRIRLNSFQVATIPEPLWLQGWILVDELNRLFAGESPDGYTLPVYLVDRANIDRHGGERNVFDPDVNYRRVFREIWNR